MYYQLPNGKVVKLSLEEYLELTDADVQFLMSIDYGDHIIDPFHGSAVENTSHKEYDFSFISSDDDVSLDSIASNDVPFDDIIDLAEDTEL
jgi:hypothetical protein